MSELKVVDHPPVFVNSSLLISDEENNPALVYPDSLEYGSEYELTWKRLFLKSTPVTGDQLLTEEELMDRQSQVWKEASMRIDDMNLYAHWNALEINPGPGLMTIPLAKKIQKVTVVEPSVSMRRELMGNLSNEGVTNVTRINSDFLEIDDSKLKKYDIILCSHAMNFFDVRKALEKMCRKTKHYFIIRMHSGVPAWEMVRCSLWPTVHGYEYVPGPKAGLVAMILREMGYNPLITYLCDTRLSRKFLSLKEASWYLHQLLDLQDLSHPAVVNYIEDNWKAGDHYRFIDTSINISITVQIGKPGCI